MEKITKAKSVQKYLQESTAVAKIWRMDAGSASKRTKTKRKKKGDRKTGNGCAIAALCVVVVRVCMFVWNFVVVGGRGGYEVSERWVGVGLVWKVESIDAGCVSGGKDCWGRERLGIRITASQIRLLQEKK